MGTTPFAKRSYKPNENFKSKFASAVYKIVGRFLETDQFKHSLTKGEEREVPIIHFLAQNLPKMYSVVKGEVVDLTGRTSPQLDVMIFDAIRNIPFYTGDSHILPAEALLASVEVKSRLTQEEIRGILKNAAKVKSLRPFGSALDVAERGRDQDDKVTCRYYHCVFAYSTDLVSKDWLKNEFVRIKKMAKEEGIDHSIVDRIIVLDKGILNLSDSVAVESTDNSQLFMYFYMHLLNFVQRENLRRRRVPYLDYAGKMSNGWVKL